MLRGRFWLWAKRLAGVFLVAFCLAYWAARTDRLSAAGYDLLFMAIDGPPMLLGVEEKTVVLALLTSTAVADTDIRFMVWRRERSSRADQLIPINMSAFGKLIKF